MEEVGKLCTSCPLWCEHSCLRIANWPWCYCRVNAGGYCHRTFDGTDVVRTVWFSDEMTPRLDWTWNNFFASAAVRFYCWRHCACNLAPNRDNKTTALWKFTNDHEMTSAFGGRWSVQNVNNGNEELIILPAQSEGGKPTSGTCGADHRQFCTFPWPEHILGDIPLYPPDTTEAVKPVPPSTDLTVCGSSCVGNPNMCKSGGDLFSCFCALPSIEDAALLGLNYFSTGAICLVLASVSSQMASSDLGRRDFTPKYIDQQGNPYICPCNATYAGNKCCGTDGMIWLDELR